MSTVIIINIKMHGEYSWNFDLINESLISSANTDSRFRFLHFFFCPAKVIELQSLLIPTIADTYHSPYQYYIFESDIK